MCIVHGTTAIDMTYDFTCIARFVGLSLSDSGLYVAYPEIKLVKNINICLDLAPRITFRLCTLEKIN